MDNIKKAVTAVAAAACAAGSILSASAGVTGDINSDGTMGDAPDSYHEALTNNGVEHIWHQLTDGDHDAISVRAHMYNFLRYAFRAT